MNCRSFILVVKYIVYYRDIPEHLATAFWEKTVQDHYHTYEPKNGHGLRHDPISSIVGPRVIGWIGTQDTAGQPNLAPYSFCNIFNYKPALIAFSSVGYKDSVRNAIETGVFTWNLATRPLAEAVNQSSLEQPVNEFELTQLTPVAGQLVAAPRVAQSPVSIECKVTQHFQMTDQHQDALNTWMVIGEVVAVHIDPALIKDGIYHCAAAQPILRGGGPADYYEISDQTLFHMYRPK